MKKRVCDIITEFLVSIGIKDVFLVSGGGSMFLIDGLACNKELNAICCHHEQAAAMAAVGYAKYKGYGTAFFTTGCGATNSITGLLHAWQDNTPCMFIAGQCKTHEVITSIDVPIRQFGIQEADTISIVKSITKYAKMVKNKEDILYELEKAYYISNEGRKGPVWLDIPMDVQSAIVETEKLKHFNINEEKIDRKVDCTNEEIEEIKEALENAKRPVIIAGQGIRLANAIPEFKTFVEKLNIPVVFSRLGLDILPTEHPLNIGRIGNKGTRFGNFTVQNADFILVLGSRLSISTTGYDYKLFARSAKIYVIDIDLYEHLKSTVKIDKIINADLKNVFNKLLCINNKNIKEWLEKCQEWKVRYPVCTKEHYDDTNGISLYAFTNELSNYLKEDAVVVTDAGSAVYVPAQAIHLYNEKQRYITSGAQAEMGFTVPGTIGVCVARGNKEVIGITGDGSLQMNIQEFQTIKYNQLNIKLFVWNNDGYLSIRETQRRIFNGRYLGTDKTSGISFPDLEKIAIAYGITYYKVRSINELKSVLNEIMKLEKPIICEVMCIKDESILTAVTSKKLPDGSVISLPIEDMQPFLNREEFNANMIIQSINT